MTRSAELWHDRHSWIRMIDTPFGNTRTIDSSGIRVTLCQMQFLSDQHHGKFGIRLEVAPGEAPRLLRQTEHPLAAGPLEEAGRPRYLAGEHVERRSNADQHRRFQCAAV